jgi:hypothetical protein
VGGQLTVMCAADARTYLLCGHVSPVILAQAMQQAPAPGDQDEDADTQAILDVTLRQPCLRRDLQRLMVRAGQATTRRERDAVEVGWTVLFAGSAVLHLRQTQQAGRVYQAAAWLAARLRASLMPEPDQTETALLQS